MFFFKRGYAIREEFPFTELLIIFIAHFASAIAVASLFPYVGYMIVDLHMSSNIESAGYYAGYISSALMLGRLTTSIFWGKIADHYGRKPVICMCCVALSIFSLLFGFSSHFWMAILSRFLIGCFNPIVGIGRTVVSEICSKKFEAIGMATINGSWFLGLIMGPIIGSLLARPVDLYPHIFNSWLIFKKFPYLLPNIFCSLLAFISFILVLFYFPETLHPLNISNQIPVEQASSKNILNLNTDVEKDQLLNQVVSVPSTDQDQPPQRVTKSLYGIIHEQGVIRILIAYFLLAPLGMTMDEIFPLWAMSSTEVGGADYSIQKVGSVISFTGIFITIFSFFIYPKLAIFLGARGSFLLGTLTTAPCFLLLSSIHLYTLSSIQTFIFFIIMISILKMFISLSFCGVCTVINNAVSVENRGSLNGVALTVDSAAKTLGLAYGPALYAWSIHGHHAFPLDFYFMFLLLSMVSLLGFSVFITNIDIQLFTAWFNQVATSDVTTEHTSGLVLPSPFSNFITKKEYSQVAVEEDL